LIPPIFASSILMFPAQIANMASSGWMQEFSSVLHPRDWRYNLIFTVLVVFFAFFYTSVGVQSRRRRGQPEEVGRLHPGIRPGKNTRSTSSACCRAITFAGALYLSVVCMIPALPHKYLRCRSASEAPAS
jgi:preprotein translocase subunit SecY